MSSAIFPVPAHMVFMMCVLHGTLQQDLSSSSIVALRHLMSGLVTRLPIDEKPEPAVNKSHCIKEHPMKTSYGPKGDKIWQKKLTTNSTTYTFTMLIELKKFSKKLKLIVIMKNTSDASWDYYS